MKTHKYRATHFSCRSCGYKAKRERVFDVPEKYNSIMICCVGCGIRKRVSLISVFSESRWSSLDAGFPGTTFVYRIEHIV